MFTRWRDQADLVIWNVWNSPVLAIIAWRILSKISIIPNKGSEGMYDFDTGGEILIIKCSTVLLQARVSKSEVSRSSSGIHAFARLNAATAPALEDGRLKS